MGLDVGNLLLVGGVVGLVAIDHGRDARVQVCDAVLVGRIVFPVSRDGFGQFRLGLAELGLEAGNLLLVGGVVGFVAIDHGLDARVQVCGAVGADRLGELALQIGNARGSSCVGGRGPPRQVAQLSLERVAVAFERTVANGPTRFKLSSLLAGRGQLGLEFGNALVARGLRGVEFQLKIGNPGAAVGFQLGQLRRGVGAFALPPFQIRREFGALAGPCASLVAPLGQ